VKLLTLGYQGLTSKQLFDLLLANKVETLIDVRELPLSRKPGFSKSALSRAANRRGLNYVHIPELGCPKAIRHDFRVDRNWARYTRRFMSYLETRDAAVQQLALRVLGERCCLMCFEADPDLCHRSYVAAQLVSVVRPSLKIVPLRATMPDQAVSLEAASVSAQKAGKPNRL
jgi:uncharacterized protein (DUF488 family)